MQNNTWLPTNKRDSFVWFGWSLKNVLMRMAALLY
jgi:hypothetical protein